MSKTAHPFLENEFHIRWSKLVPEAIEPDIREALVRAQEHINRLSSPFEASELTF